MEVFDNNNEKQSESDRIRGMLSELGVYQYESPRIRVSYSTGRIFEGRLKSITDKYIFLEEPDRQLISSAVDKIEILNKL